MVTSVSVIITTKNEEEHIGNCLESIRKQDYLQEKIEIIVVDNNSTDRTKEIARTFTDKIFNYGPERSAQRNFGVRESKGKYILYLDADMVLSEDVTLSDIKYFLKAEGNVLWYLMHFSLNKKGG